MTTLTPWEARRRTVAYPRPEAPPVTIATKELSIFIFMMLSIINLVDNKDQLFYVT